MNMAYLQIGVKHNPPCMNRQIVSVTVPWVRGATQDALMFQRLPQNSGVHEGT